MIHRVQQGEHLPAISLRYGFSDWRTIWEHPDNTALRELRGNPSVLYPGDEVYVPDRTSGTEPCASDQRHRFVLRGGSLVLRLMVLDLAGQPVANTACTLRVGTREESLATDAGGVVEVPIRRNDTRGLLRVERLGIEIPLEIGHLDPVDTDTGMRARLANLGYLDDSSVPESPQPATAETGSEDGAQDLLLLLAIEEFQCEHGLSVDGVFGPTTQEKLLEVHGC